MKFLSPIFFSCLFLSALSCLSKEPNTPGHYLAEGIINLHEQQPILTTKITPEVVVIDFGRVAYANVQILSPESAEELTVRFGENSVEGRVDRKPPGTVRYSEVVVSLDAGVAKVVAPPTDARNTNIRGRRHPPAILTPSEWGVVFPFRWLEIEGPAEVIEKCQVIRRAAFAVERDPQKAHFECSDEMLNRVWDLCEYSIEATLFAGVYVDGDRERIPYEADAYINQLSHYYVEADPRVARLSFDWLMKHPTWPTEWGPHMVFMAYADWMQTADADWLGDRYESLKEKMLNDRVGKSGLVLSDEKQVSKYDIIDWPNPERDGFVFTELNTVVNAFHLATLERMAVLAEAVGKKRESLQYRELWKQRREKFNQTFYDDQRGLYRDGADVEHYSSHANFFPLAFGLAPEEHREALADWLAKRGMRCSVYGAQYFLEALFENGKQAEAIDLMIAPGDRSWRHMINQDATITWEAWDVVYKPNLDWNHAWGAAPANLLPRYVLGVQPITPGWKTVQIHPCPGKLTYAKGKVPTPLGPIQISWNNEASLRYEVDLPEGITAQIELPNALGSKQVYLNGKAVKTKLVEGYSILSEDVQGKCVFEIR